jgi:hypothetical protein
MYGCAREAEAEREDAGEENKMKRILGHRF